MTAPRLIRNRPLLAQRADLIGQAQADAEAAQYAAIPWPVRLHAADDYIDFEPATEVGADKPPFIRVIRAAWRLQWLRVLGWLLVMTLYVGTLTLLVLTARGVL